MGNEDGVKYVLCLVIYVLFYIGFIIFFNVDMYWVGEVGLGLFFIEVEGYKNDFIM